MHSPFYSDFDTLLLFLGNEDDILLLQDGVLTAIDNSYYLNRLLKYTKNILALEADIKARGLIEYIAKEVKLGNYTDFVSLTVKHKQQMVW